MNTAGIRKRTVKDFGNQWKIHGKIDEDYWSSDQYFKDYFKNHFNPKVLKNKVVGDVGSGSGRIIQMLSKYKLKKIYAIEPSIAGIKKIRENLSNLKNLRILNKTGNKFKTDKLCDFIFSMGVIHHIKDPEDILKNIYKNLKKKGYFILWVYGYENNYVYILFYNLISKITKKLPDKILDFFSSILNILIEPYIFLCRYINLPLKKYLINNFSKFSWEKRKYVIFDQLNPTYAHFYTKKELRKLLNNANFKNLRFFHKDKYSWTVVCKKS